VRARDVKKLRFSPPVTQALAAAVEKIAIPYLTLKGIPSSTAPSGRENYFIRDPQGTWLPAQKNNLPAIEKVCVQIHEALAIKIFGSSKAYWDFLPTAPEILSVAGINSEANISKDQFEKILPKLPTKLPINKALYLYDCRKLVSSIQECSKEITQLQGEFYQELNLGQLFFPNIKEDDGLRWVTSPTVTKLFALLGFVYIRLHSLLDYTTKLAVEIESLRQDFESYPKLRAKNTLFGDKRRVSINGQADTVFEDCETIREIETIRNHIIHDGLLDDVPKVYKLNVDGQCIEKYILLPDRGQEGRFEAYKNRNLFYGSDDKINLRLPVLVANTQVRLVNTLNALLKNMVV
jgi:hypothetical protein